MIPVAEALARVLALAGPLATEAVALRQAAGRVLAAPVIARLTQPPFAASAMDGYAIREEDHLPGRVLEVIGEAAAGRGFGGTVGTGEAARIFTGAPVPAGAGRVILQEDVTRDRSHQHQLRQPAGQTEQAAEEGPQEVGQGHKPGGTRESARGDQRDPGRT